MHNPPILLYPHNAPPRLRNTEYLSPYYVRPTRSYPGDPPIRWMVVWSGGTAYAVNVAIFDAKEEALHRARCLNELNRSGAAPHLKLSSAVHYLANQKA
jgi:hypothetical protein